jgi:hypothetical protein
MKTEDKELIGLSPLGAGTAAPVVPDGWKLVPTTPTKAMYKATWECKTYVAFDRFKDDYDMMLDAAPTLPEAAEGESMDLPMLVTINGQKYTVPFTVREYINRLESDAEVAAKQALPVAVVAVGWPNCHYASVPHPNQPGLRVVGYAIPDADVPEGEPPSVTLHRLATHPQPACNFPLCQSKDDQEKIAAQVHAELYGAPTTAADGADYSDLDAMHDAVDAGIGSPAVAPLASSADVGSHHLTPEAIDALVSDLQSCAEGTEVPSINDRDWRTRCAVIKLVIDHLRATPAAAVELPPLPKAHDTLTLLPGEPIASRERFTADQMQNYARAAVAQAALAGEGKA